MALSSKHEALARCDWAWGEEGREGIIVAMGIAISRVCIALCVN